MVCKEMGDLADHLRSVVKDMKKDLEKGKFSHQKDKDRKMSEREKLLLVGSITALEGTIKTLIIVYGVEPKSADEAFALVERDFMAFVEELSKGKEEEK